MTEKEILEGILIANFDDNMKPDPSDYKSESWLRGQEWYHKTQLKYHSSWEWIMPVVEKIESIESSNDRCFETSVEICGTHVEIIMGLPIRSMDKIKCEYRSGNNGETKILAVWRAVVDFITWYNQNKNI